MTTADEVETEFGDPLFQTTLRAFAEGLDGNGILDAGDLEVTAGTNANALDVAATTTALWYDGADHTYAGGTNVLTLSDNTSGDPRWDLVYFDTSTDTPDVREGTPATNPDLPAPQAGEVVLAAVHLPDGTTDVTDVQIKNYRVHGSEAGETRLDDSAGDYSSDTVEGAFTEVVRQAGDPLNGPLDLSSFSGTAPFDLGTNPTAFGAIVDATVDSNSTAGTVHSYTFEADGTALLTLYVESDGSGGIQNAEVQINQSLNLPAGEISTADLADAAVVTAKLAADAVTATELADAVDLETMRSRDNVVAGSVSVGTNPGAFGALLDATVDGTPAAGTEESFSLAVDGTSILTVYAEADGAGGVQNARVEHDTPLHLLTQSAEPSDTTQGVGYYDSDEDTVRISDGANYRRVEARPNVDSFSSDESGTVAAGDAGVVYRTRVLSTETLKIVRAGLTLSDGQPAPTDLDLTIATEDNAGGATSQTNILTGDGTVQDKKTGTLQSPVASFSPGSDTTVVIVVDNGNFNTGTGSSQDIFADVKGEVE